MDLPRFISMLSTRQLRFTRAAIYKDDLWEGFCEVKHLEFPPELTKHSRGHAIYALASNYSRKEYESALQRLYVNSWCRWRESMSFVSSGGAGSIIARLVARAGQSSSAEVRLAFTRRRRRRPVHAPCASA